MTIDCYCNYDRPSFYLAMKPKARKSHKCDECSGHIEPGSKYERVTAKWDYVSTFKTCRSCFNLRIWVQNNVPCLCWEHGNLHENLKYAVEAAAYRAPEETVGLRFGFLRRSLIARRARQSARRDL